MELRNAWIVSKRLTALAMRSVIMMTAGLSLFWSLFQAAPVYGATIGAEASVPLPNSALWSTIVNNRPGDGEIVTMNPPQFSWTYTPNPRETTADIEAKNFLFVIAGDPGFSSVVFSNLTRWNFYNTLAPFTNSTLYWKVGYCHESNTSAYVWSAVRRFTIAPNAAAWDRSQLANSAYLSSKSAHPHVLFNAGNRIELSNWLQSAEASYSRSSPGNTLFDVLYGPGKGWSIIKSQASNALLQTWWPNTRPGMWVGASGSWPGDIANVSFMWALTRNSSWSNAHPEIALTNLAHFFMTNDDGTFFNSDAIASSSFNATFRALAVSYDWCYDLMNDVQRSNVCYAIAMRCRYLLCGQMSIMYDSKTYDYTYGRGDPTGLYSSGFYCRNTAQSKLGHSHGTDNFYHGMLGALAAYGDHPWAREFFDMGVNYMLGPTYIYASSFGVGRGYTSIHLWVENRAMDAHINYLSTFPELAWTKNPFWLKIADFWDRTFPVQFTQGHEPWGDGGYGRIDTFGWENRLMGRAMSLWTGQGSHLQHYNRECYNWKYLLIHDPSEDNVWTAPFPYYFQYTNTVEQSLTNLAACYTNEGWVVSSSESPSTASGFTNGVGIIYQARPAGSVTGHGYPSDGSFQIWAYGALVTDGGGTDIYGSYGPYPKVPWAHYTLLVNGLGQCQPQQVPVEPWYSRISGYTNCESFTYWASDLTGAYARSNFVAGGDTVPQVFAGLHSGGPLSYLSNVTRQVLFNRKKYFVVYDTMQTGNFPTNTFSWIYHVPEDTLALNAQTMAFNYSVTNQYTGSNISVYVAHVINPNLMTVTDLTGTSVRKNPITGENYWTNSPPSNIGDIRSRAHALWFSNRIPANRWHFMSVIYPVRPGSSAPKINRLDDFTVGVTNGLEGDVITFDPRSASTFGATIIIDPASMGASPQSGAAPQRPGGIRLQQNP